MGKILIISVKNNKKMSQRLQKPTFCKITDIKAGRHCYNVYCKVIELNASEITKFNGEVIRIADGVVGDDTAVANFRLVGDNVGKVQPEEEKTFDRIKNSENISSYAYVKKEK